MEVTLRFQDTGAVPGDGRPVRMTGDCLTVGRGPENDLQLPDPDRMLSKRHCVIEARGADVVVIDLSTNGTFLNYAGQPLGAAPTVLGDGDVLSVGPYELKVGIGAGGAAAAPAPGWDDLLPPATDPGAPAPRDMGGIDDPLADAGGDFLDDLLGESPAGPRSVRRPELGADGALPPLGTEDGPGWGGDRGDGLGDGFGAGSGDGFGFGGASGAQHSGAEFDHFAPPRASAGPGTAIPDDWDDLLAPGPADASPPPPAPSPPTPTPAPPIPEDPFAEPGEGAGAGRPAAPTPPPLPPEPAGAAPAGSLAAAPPPAGGTAQGDAAARAFLDALGAAGLDIPDDELAAVMARLGAVTRALLTGAREVLMTRSSIKSEFRIEQTRIGAGGNNPLKFSVSPEQAVRAMVRPDAAGYLDPVDAAAEAMRDIRVHEMAVAAGMEAALKGILATLAPAELEKKLDSGGGLSGLLKGRKARYWEIYESMYAEIAGAAASDFHDRFARAFARAYAAQIERLR